jgi:hypothetical protein
MALTRKVKKGSSNGKSGLMTIPQLRTAFDHLEKKTAHILKTKSKVTRVEEFQKEWKKLFKRPITASSAKEYLEFCDSQGKGKVQSGGAAPLDYMMGPGAAEPYGSFPSYLTAGFDVGVPRDSFSAQCGKEDATPVLSASFGSNLVGGKRKGTRKAAKKQKGGMARLFQSTVPVGYGTEVSTLLRGQLNPATSPSPVANPIAPANFMPVFSGTTAKTAW